MINSDPIPQEKLTDRYMDREAKKRRVEDQSPSAALLTKAAAAAAPDVYLRVEEKFKNHCFWYKLDLENQKPVFIDWQHDKYLHNSSAVALKSEIYLVGRGPDNPKNNVYRINTAGVPTSSSRFESGPSIFNQLDYYCKSAVLSDKIILLNPCWSFHDNQQIMEIFYRSSDRWLGFFPAELALPRELKGDFVSSPLVSDSQNNRILMHFYFKGLYAFYPESFTWECLCYNPNLNPNLLLHFESSVLVKDVLYYCFKSDDRKQLYALGAMDMSEGLKPLEVVWPGGFDHRFFYEATWMAPIDLGEGRLGLVAQFHECLNPSKSMYKRDDLYYYSKDKDADKYVEKKYMLVVTCMILEVEKQPPPHPDSGGLRRKATLIVKSTSCFSFKFENFICSSHSWMKVADILVVSG